MHSLDQLIERAMAGVDKTMVDSLDILKLMKRSKRVRDTLQRLRKAADLGSNPLSDDAL